MTKWSTGSSVWTRGRTSSLWGWRSPGTGCPGRWWSLLLWSYLRPAWTRSSAACCRWPCFSRRVGLDGPQRSLRIPTILWFCDHRLMKGSRKGKKAETFSVRKERWLRARWNGAKPNMVLTESFSGLQLEGHQTTVQNKKRQWVFLRGLYVVWGTRAPRYQEFTSV